MAHGLLNIATRGPAKTKAFAKNMIDVIADSKTTFTRWNNEIKEGVSKLTSVAGKWGDNLAARSPEFNTFRDNFRRTFSNFGDNRVLATEFGQATTEQLAKHGDEVAKYGDNVSKTLQESTEQLGKKARREVGQEATEQLAKHGDEVAKHGDEVSKTLKESTEQVAKKTSQEVGQEATEQLAKHGDEVATGLKETAEQAGKKVSQEFSQETSEQLAKHGDDVAKGLEETAENTNKAVREVEYGEQFTKGVNGRKELLPNVQYVTESGYRYTTDEFGRISRVEVDELVLKKGKRNAHSQRVAGREFRVTEAELWEGLDDGGHLIGTQFNGPGDLDNLVAMNREINRRGGTWYNMEEEWAKALKEVPPRKVTVDIQPVYSGNSLRPDRFEVVYQIEGDVPKFKTIENQIGG